MKTDTTTGTPLRQRMIEDMAARNLNRHTQRSHISSCKRFAVWLKRSPDTATADEVRLFQLHLIESGASICNRNRIMTGVRFLFRVTLRRHDLAAEVWHLKEPLKLPPVLSPEEVKRVLTMATSLKARVMLTLCYGCGLRAGEVVRLTAGDIDSEQMIIRIVQSKGRKDRHVMLPEEVLDLLREWWKERPRDHDAAVAPRSRWLFPGRSEHRGLTTRQFNRGPQPDAPQDARRPRCRACSPRSRCTSRAPGFSQASQIHKRDEHIRGQRRYVEHKRFNESFLMNASTSPFYPLFASLDVNAKVHEGKAGEMLWDRCIELGIEARKKFREFCHYYAAHRPKRRGEVVLRSVRARRGDDPRLEVHRGRRRRRLGGSSDRGDQARAAVLELPSRERVARLRGLCRRLRDGRSEQAHAADARHRSQDRRVPGLRRARDGGRQLPARAARRAGEVRSQQHPVPDDAGRGREQAQHADREAGQVQESLGPRRAAARGAADGLCGASASATRATRCGRSATRCTTSIARRTSRNCSGCCFRASSFPELAMSPKDAYEALVANDVDYVPLEEHQGPHLRDARADLSAGHRRRRARRALGRQRASRCSTTSWPSRNRSTASRASTTKCRACSRSGWTAASSSTPTSFANERTLGTKERAMEDTNSQEDEPDAADVHRRGEHDGLGHHHAADEHGAGRRDLAAVLDRDGASARWPSPTASRRPASSTSAPAAWRPTPRMPTASRATSWCSSSTSCRWRSATWRSPSPRSAISRRSSRGSRRRRSPPASA